MKKILMISQSTYDYDSRIIRFTDALIENNYKVDVISLRLEDQKKYEEVNGVRVFRIMKSFPQDTIFSYIFNSSVYLLKAFLKCTLLTLKKDKPDVIHIHNMPDYLVFSTIFAKLRGIPIILDMHDLVVELFKEKWAEKTFNRIGFLLKFSEKISSRYVNHLITVTKECVDILVKRGVPSQKISLIMNSADEKIFTYNEPIIDKQLTHKILYHGTIARRFGLHYFIKAMPAIVEAIPDLEFHLYGNFNTQYSDEFQSLVNDSGLEKNVIYHKKIPYSELNDMIIQYDLGIVIYEQTEYMNLALPTKSCEYAMTGLPFIISELTSVKSIFKTDSVFYVNPLDTKMISETVIKFFKDPTIGKKHSKKAYEDVKGITWNIMRARYLTLISEM